MEHPVVPRSRARWRFVRPMWLPSTNATFSRSQSRAADVGQITHERRGDAIERNDVLRRTALDGFLGHSVDDARALVLGDRARAC